MGDTYSVGYVRKSQSLNIKLGDYTIKLNQNVAYTEKSIYMILY
jgi:hypothetical protein